MSFDNIIGNDKIKNDLISNVKSNNILHSYMFIGEDGIGKKLFAKEFAKEILCINKEFSNCSSCIKFDSNNHPDYMLINDSGETISIDQIRDIINKINEKPIVSERKVYIINDSEKMTVDASNCLLKTLEEPPEYAIIILICSNESMMLNTVKSRCMKIKFKNLTEAELNEYLQTQTNYTNISKNLLKLINGSIGNANKLLENQEIYKQIDDIINTIDKESITDYLNKSKLLYNKEEIGLILNYMIVSFYEESKRNRRFLNCISYITETTKRLKSNANFDMTMDNLLLNVWEEING